MDYANIKSEKALQISGERRFDDVLQPERRENNKGIVDVQPLHRSTITPTATLLDQKRSPGKRRQCVPPFVVITLR